MSRDQNRDVELLAKFAATLNEFRKMKMEKWEKIDDQVQASIHPGTPTEDWIIPPDEKKTESILNNDPTYTKLREQILAQKEEVKQIAAFLGVDLHHSFDWLNFNSPLIGNAALEDCIDFAQTLREACAKASYWMLYLKNVFS